MDTLHHIYSTLANLWETIVCFLLIGVYAFMGRYKSVLQVAFIITYYWGFQSILKIGSMSSDENQSTVILYIVSGLAIFGLMSVNYLIMKKK